MAKTKRDDEISTRPAIKKRLLEIYGDIESGFVNQRSRTDDGKDYWDCYNSQLGPKQFYSGNSKIFVPIVRNAINARRTRFTNQLFPRAGRHIDVATDDGTLPYETISLLEHYVRAARLRTEIVPSMLVAGDVEGQWALYVDWTTVKRNVARRVVKGVMVDGEEMPGDQITSVESEMVEIGHPSVEVIADSDLMVVPVTANSIDEAISVGGSVTVVRRWTADKVRQMIKSGDIDEAAGETLIRTMSKKTGAEDQDTKKRLAEAAGIQVQDGLKFAQVYETWTNLKVDNEMRLCRVYYGGEDQIVGCKLCPYWCDLPPVISIPVEKVPGVFKGRSQVADVFDTQVMANDSVNEGADTAHFSAMPIIMTNPEKNPRVGTMVLGLASVWETSPQDTQFAQFPALWKDMFAIVGACKNEIFQTLGVNPSMVPMSSGGADKRNQAEVAQEQQVDILTTADVCTALEEGILTPLLQRFAYYDHQFREDDLVIKAYGPMGLKANMQAIPPIQMNHRFELSWCGVEAARNVAQVQQGIAAANVIRGIPPQQYQGFTLDMSPLITQIVENAFGPRLAPLIFKDMKSQLSVPAEQENELLAEGFECMVHPPDNDAEHMQVHMQELQATQDPHGTIRPHMKLHQQQMQAKMMAQVQMQQPQGAGGLPGSPGGAGPGVAGTPALSPPGADPSGPQSMQGPPGMISHDSMPAAGAAVMPRQM